MRRLWYQAFYQYLRVHPATYLMKGSTVQQSVGSMAAASTLRSRAEAVPSGSCKCTPAGLRRDEIAQETFRPAALTRWCVAVLQSLGHVS